MAKTKKQPTPSKKPAAKAVKTTAPAQQKTVSEPKKEEKNSWLIPLLAIAAVVVIGFVAYRWLVIAKVNGAVIDRVTYYKELRRQAGKQVMEDMITRQLMKQALAEKKIVISDKDIDSEIAKLETQLKSRNQNLDVLLKQQGVTRQELRENIALNKGFEKYFANEVQVTDKEAQEYIDQNPSSFAEGTSDANKLAQAKQLLKTQKLTQAYQEWQTETRKKAAIVIVNQ